MKKKSALGAALGTTAASSALTRRRWLHPDADPSLAMYVDTATRAARRRRQPSP
ncbi:hypothetical protein MJ575_11600 [Klebsiella pneumoniae]|nr:hypothetical protein MJ575_11600 [Klebsiella pneumoniae]